MMSQLTLWLQIRRVQPKYRIKWLNPLSKNFLQLSNNRITDSQINSVAQVVNSKTLIFLMQTSLGHQINKNLFIMNLNSSKVHSINKIRNLYNRDNPRSYQNEILQQEAIPFNRSKFKEKLKRSSQLKLIKNKRCRCLQ